MTQVMSPGHDFQVQVMSPGHEVMSPDMSHPTRPLGGAQQRTQ